MPTYDARPVATAASSAASVSSIGVSSSQMCTCHRSTWSTPRRRSDWSRLASRLPREASYRRATAAEPEAGLGGDDDLVAGDDGAEQAAEQLLGRALP